MLRPASSLLPTLILAWTMSAPASEPLMDRLDQIRARHGVAAVALTLVDAEGTRYLGARGVADRASGRPMTPDTPVRIGSITKTFNGLLFLILDGAGRLSLDAPLHEVAPAAPLANPWEAGRPVRIVHLLEHTAGLADLTKEEFDHNTPFPSLAAALGYRPEARRALWPPGMHHSYSNAGAGLATFAAEAVVGEPYEALMTRLVLRPLGMTEAGLGSGAQTQPELATGYDSDGTTPIPYWHMIFPAMGAIDATPREMAALPRLLWGRGAIEGRRLLPESAIDRMETPATTLAAEAGRRFGYGLGLDSYADQGLVWHGHGGDGDGYLSHFAYQRELGLGYFVTFNAFNRRALGEMQGVIRAHLSEGQARPPGAVPADLGVAELDALAGGYEPATLRFAHAGTGAAREIRRDGAGLRVSGGDGDSVRLIPVTRCLFRRPEEPVATSAFVSYEGALYWQGEDGSYRRVGQ